jgi:3-oxoacyl-[acyl-carrier protein] reductase
VTGAGRGIGRAIASRLAREGARIAVADIREEDAQQTAADLRVAGADAISIATDVTDADRVQQLMETVREKMGRIDVLVNNAGVGLNRPFLQTTPEEFERTIRVNLTGTFLCSQAAARRMAEQGGGRIVNIASISGERGAQNRSAYGASKAGVIQLTKVMAVELAPLGIRVNAVAPGPVATAMTSVTHPPEVRESYHQRIPLKRYAQADEIASAVYFLAGESSSFITGHVLNVDGGFMAAGLIFEQR